MPDKPNGGSLPAVEILAESGSYDPGNCNVDVVARFPDGATYVATFFTIDNLRSLMQRWRTTGESGDGLYVWSTDMIVVEEVSEEIVARVIRELLANNDFDTAFSFCPLPQE